MIVLALGKKGCGKSALIRKLGHRASLEESVCLVWHDPAAQLRVAGALTVATVREAKEAIQKAGMVPRVTIIRADSADATAQLALGLKKVTLVLDELDLVCSDKRWTSKAAKHIVHYGRHEQIGLMGSFRRTQNVAEDLLAQADNVFIFKHSSGGFNDFEMLRKRFGDEVAVAATQTLKPMEFIAWKDQ